MSQTTGVTPDLPPRIQGYQPVAKEVAASPDTLELGEPRELQRPRRPLPWGNVFTYALLLAGAAVLTVPFVWMVAASLDTADAVAAAEVDFAFNDPQWANFPDSLRMMGMTLPTPSADRPITTLDVVRTRFPALSNTIVITTLCIVGQVLSSSLVGFGFARFSFRGRNMLFLLMLSTMMLPYQVTMIPVFVLFRSLGMIDTFWPLIIPAWVASPFFAFMFRQFFAQVPEELMEAARIDGASHWTIYWRMMLPLSGPVIAIVAIFTFMTTWNDFMAPLIYINSPENQTLALALAAFNGQYGVQNANLLMAASFLTMLPCIILFFAAQKYFVESVASSGLKS